MPTVETEHLQGIALLLVQDKILDKEKALHYQQLATSKKLSLLQFLVGNNILPARQLAFSVAQNFGVPMLDLDCFDWKPYPFH